MQQIYQRLRLTIILFLVIISLFIFFGIYRPLTKELEHEVLKSYQLITYNKHQVLEEYVMSVRYNAASLSSRSVIRDMLADYLDGKVTFAELKAFTIPRYTDGVAVFEQLRSAARVAIDGRVIHSIGVDESITNFIRWDEKKLVSRYIPEDKLVMVQSPVKKGEQILAYDLIFSDAIPIIAQLEEGLYELTFLQEKRNQEMMVADGRINSYIDSELLEGTIVISTAEPVVFDTVRNLMVNINIRYFLALIIMFITIQFLIVRYIRGFIKTQQRLKAAAEEREKERNRLIEEMNKGFLLLKVGESPPGEFGVYEIVDVNRTFEAMINMEDGMLLGKSLAQIIPMKAGRGIEQMIATMSEGESKQFEYYIDGLECWWQMSAYPPQEGYLAIICEDITGKKSTEAKLKDSEERMGVTLDVTGEGLWDWHITEGMVYHNKRWCTILGLDDSYLAHKMEEFANRIHPDDREQVLKSINEAIESQGEYFSEHRMIRHNGSVIWVVDRGVGVKNSDGKVERMIGSIADITQRKQAQQDLFIEKETFQSTLLSVGDGIIATNVNGRITVLNPVAEELTGWNQQEAIGRNIDEVLRLVHPKTGKPIKWRESVSLKNQPTKGNDNLISLVSRSGKELTIFESIAPIHLPDGEVTGFVMAFKDVTEVFEKQKKIEYLSFHDELTGLYNRRYMEDALHRLDTNRNLPFTIMMLDLNNLKLTNDIFGHELGDSLIKKTAELLGNIFRVEDIVARIGGDEFCVLMPKTSLEVAQAVKERIQNESSLYRVGSVRLSIAVGFAAKTKKVEQIEAVLRDADFNMYQDKQQRRQEVSNAIPKLVTRFLKP